MEQIIEMLQLWWADAAQPTRLTVIAFGSTMGLLVVLSLISRFANPRRGPDAFDLGGLQASSPSYSSTSTAFASPEPAAEAEDSSEELEFSAVERRARRRIRVF